MKLRGGVAGLAQYVLARGGEIIGALRDGRQELGPLVGAAVAAMVAAPAVEALGGEKVHGRDIARRLQIETRRGGHRGAVHEQDGAAPGLAGARLLPQEQLLAIDRGPVLAALA